MRGFKSLPNLESDRSSRSTQATIQKDQPAARGNAALTGVGLATTSDIQTGDSSTAAPTLAQGALPLSASQVFVAGAGALTNLGTSTLIAGPSRSASAGTTLSSGSPTAGTRRVTNFQGRWLWSFHIDKTVPRTSSCR